MRNEIEYNLFVKQPVEHVMNQVEEDAKQFQITAEELNRAVLGWVLDRIKAGDLPDWFLTDLKTD